MSLSHFYTYTINDFVKLHDDIYANQTKSSKNIFKSTLHRLERVYGEPLEKLEMVYCKNVNDLYNVLLGTTYSENTMIQTISTCVKILKMIDAPLTLINSYVSFMKQKNETIQHKKKLEIQSEYSLTPDWKTIKDKVMSKFDYYTNGENTINYNDYLNYLILNLFVLQPPNRGLNYVNCKLHMGKTIPDDTSHNYLLIDNKQFTFIFNNNRKNSILPQRVLAVTDDRLKKLLDIYLTNYYINGKNRWFLKNNTNKELRNIDIQKAVKKTLLILVQENLSIDDLRASYLRHIYKMDLDLLDNIEIINMLGIQNLPLYLQK
jgi:hypothetical protein